MEEPWSGAGSARLTPVSGWEKGSLMSVSKKKNRTQLKYIERGEVPPRGNQEKEVPIEGKQCR